MVDKVWEELHSTKSWGKYPEVDLIRQVARTFPLDSAKNFHVLEMGCGAGANLSFFLNEGFQVSGIDGAPSAIDNAHKRLDAMAKEGQIFDLRAGNFTQLPWDDNQFDIVVDYMAIYANKMADIETSIGEAYRALKSGGYIYSRVWGMGTQGYDSGEEIEAGTSNNPTTGPCAQMGISHFFTKDELEKLYSGFSTYSIREVTTTNHDDGEQIIEWIIWAQK